VSLRPEVRLPFADLMEASGATNLEDLARLVDYGNNHISARRRVYRWRDEGIPFHSADRVACFLRLHPASVWAQAWWDACWAQDELEQEAQADRQMMVWIRNQGPERRKARREVVAGYSAVERARLRWSVDELGVA
jgi:hypothetical protein